MLTCTIDLASIKEGDRVAWVRGYDRGASIGTVTRLTRTMIIVECTGSNTPYRFRRHDGAMVGNHFTFLRNPTDNDIVARQTMSYLRRAIDNINHMTRLDPKTAEEGINILKEIERLAHMTLTVIGNRTS